MKRAGCLAPWPSSGPRVAPDGQRLPRLWVLAARWGEQVLAWHWMVKEWPVPSETEQRAGAQLCTVRDAIQRGLFILVASIESVQRRLECGQHSPDVAADLAACEARLARLHALMAEGNQLAKEFQRWRAEQAPRPAGVPVTIRLPLAEHATVAVITDP